MSTLAALVLAAAAVLPVETAPLPSPAEAGAILAEVRKPGAAAVLVNVWATWCSPCREEFPDLLHVARELAPDGLRLVLVSVDFPGIVRVGNDEKFVDGLERQWSGAIPATFLYDAKGKLVRFWEGKASYPIIKKRAREALEAKETR